MCLGPKSTRQLVWFRVLQDACVNTQHKVQEICFSEMRDIAQSLTLLRADA